MHVVAVSGSFLDAAGRVLLVHTPRRGWECPGGQVELGETLEDALAREVMEEAGARVIVERLVAVYTNPTFPPKVMFHFVGRAEGDAVAGDECTDAGWFTPDEARALVTFEANRMRLDDGFKRHERPVYRVYGARPFVVSVERTW